MNETIAKLTPHLPLDELNLDDAVAAAKAVKHNLEQRYKPQPRKSKARILIPVLLAFLVGAVVAAKLLGDRGASQPAPYVATNQTNDANVAAAGS